MPSWSPRPSGPQSALELTDELPLDHYYLFHAIRADLFRRLGHRDQAETAYRAAIERTENAAEIAFMEERICSDQSRGTPAGVAR